MEQNFLQNSKTPSMGNIRRAIFLMFVVSGFCGLLYQVIWIRIAYASFGIITPVMSVVISVFMLGLLLGSAAGGPVVKKLVQRFRRSAILFYALAEFGIGLGAFCVPSFFRWNSTGCSRSGA